MKMNREQVIKILKQNQAALTELGVKSLVVFGSVARDEASADSDLDILIEFDRKPVTFDVYMDVKIYLEDLLDVTVDLVVAETLHPRVKTFVSRDAVYVV